jgi:hypothetical protein
MGSGFSLGKSPGILYTNSHLAEVRPKTSGNEYGFLRGGALTYSLKNIEATAFYSNRNIDANWMLPDTSATDREYVSSILETGYHRTVPELANRNVLNQSLYGGHITYTGKWFRVGSTAYHISHDLPIEPRSALCNLFYPDLKENIYVGFDYIIGYKRLNLYGEVTQQIKHGIAALQGLSFVPDPRLAISLVYRNYQKDFLNLFSNAFGETTNNNNEKGLYVGILSTPMKRTTLTAYVDMFSYPWLKYRVDEPSKGHEQSVQVDYRITNRATLSVRYRVLFSPLNINSQGDYLNHVGSINKRYIRWQLDYEAFSWLTMRSRIDWIGLKTPDLPSGNGYLIYQDVSLHPASRPWSVALRYCLFQTDSYDTRLFTYEKDMPYSFSVPSYYGIGCRFYIYFQWHFLKYDEIGLRFSQTAYSDRNSVSSGRSQIDGNTKSDLKLMLKINF